MFVLLQWMKKEWNLIVQEKERERDRDREGEREEGKIWISKMIWKTLRFPFLFSLSITQVH